jgi:phosphatidylglycerophosphatase A
VNAQPLTMQRARNPSWRFVLRHPAHFIAFAGGVGLAPVAPGSFGTLLAFPIHRALAPWMSTMELLGVIALLFALGIWACAVTGRALGVADHGGMVWDEVVAFLLVLALTPSWSYWEAYALVLFRLFDIAKPPPIRHYDRTLKGGFGVMFDDLLAAFYTLVVMAITKRLV